MNSSSSLPRFFGTDGIRAEAFGSLLNINFAKKLGHAVAKFLEGKNLPLKILIARDTRLSGVALEEAFLEGFMAHYDSIVLQGGVAPTPCLAYGTQHFAASLGVMITASHNPKKYNGFKFFHEDGSKITLQDELKIEALLDDDCSIANRDIHGEEVDLFLPYFDLIQKHFPINSFRGFKVVLDTAHGATCSVSSKILTQMGVELIHIAQDPDGDKINDNVGSEHPELLIEAVLQQKADLGFAHDGDGDRLVVVDQKGEVIPGEILMGLFAQSLSGQYPLDEKVFATTVQSNTGLDAFVEGLGGQIVRTDVGDRNVAEALKKHNGLFGGEPSGHFIFPKVHSSGDGLLGALFLLKIIKERNQPLHELKKTVTLYPQLTHNVHVLEKKPLANYPELLAIIQDIEESLSPKGRILVRYSGTEPLLRILLEGPSGERLHYYLERLKAAL